MADFGNHPGAGNRFLNNFGDPAAAADGCRRALDANFFAAAGIAGVADALFNDRAGDLASLRHPFTTALVHRATFSHRLEGRVADVLPAGLGFSFPGGAADVAVAGLINGFADSVAHCSVAGLVDGLANGVADISVAGLVDGLADTAGDVAVARLIHRLAHGVALCPVTGLIDRLADRVAFVPIAGLVDVFRAGDGTCFGAVVVNGFHAVVLFGFPNNVLLNTAACGCAAPCCHEISAG